jgi:hypothetical protein
MSKERKLVPRAALTIAVGVIVGILAIAFFMVRLRAQPFFLTGAVTRQDADPQKQSPIENVMVTATDGQSSATGESDFSGYFRIALPRAAFQKGQAITVEFQHPDYWPLHLRTTLTGTLVVARMRPIHPEAVIAPRHPEMPVANLSIRYSIRTRTDANIGTGVKMFEVQNTPNAPCNHGPRCSPDGKWKASLASASLDAGEGNTFQNARVSCIAGPCPFTKIDVDHFSKGGRTISVSVRDWSATTTFLLEAEVSHPQVSDVVRKSYPVILGRAFNFTVPAAAQGVSLEAEVNKTSIIFPLGPDAILTWANCETKTAAKQTKSYRCELKPSYKFE